MRLPSPLALQQRRSRTALRASIEQHSKSFALAARLLPPRVGRDAVVLYAYCRRADDMIDLCPVAEQQLQLDALRRELDGLYAGVPQSDPLLDAFVQVVRERAVPRTYLDELLLGMEMDVLGVHYGSMADLLLYAYRVAGTVGLMMCHIMGVRHADALKHAAHLGMAMQLTNIARDVHEDWGRGRLYVPEALLEQCSVPPQSLTLGTALPPAAAAGLARATERLLDYAAAYYRSGDKGVCYLSARCGLSIRAARLVYSEIGLRLRVQGCDPFAPRAVVGRRRKLELVGHAAWQSVTGLPKSALSARTRVRVPTGCITEPATLFTVL